MRERCPWSLSQAKRPSWRCGRPGSRPSAIGGWPSPTFGLVRRPEDRPGSATDQRPTDRRPVRLGFDPMHRKGADFATAIDDARKVRSRDGRCLLSGETGTGKEVLARAVHHASARARSVRRPRLRALPRDARRIQLFGHGAARLHRRGPLRAAASSSPRRHPLPRRDRRASPRRAASSCRVLAGAPV